jgi:pyocin large subunit-like protein
VFSTVVDGLVNAVRAARDRTGHDNIVDSSSMAVVVRVGDRTGTLADQIVVVRLVASETNLMRGLASEGAELAFAANSDDANGGSTQIYIQVCTYHTPSRQKF